MARSFWHFGMRSPYRKFPREILHDISTSLGGVVWDSPASSCY